MRFSLHIRDLVVASWKIERGQAEGLLPPRLEPAAVGGDYLISLVAMRHQGGRAGRLRIPSFSQLNVRTYVAHEEEDAVYFLLARVTVPGLVGVLLGAPYWPSRISVRPGAVEAPGLGVSLGFRPGGVSDSGPIGRHEVGIFGRGRLRAIRIHRSPTLWREAEATGPLRADPILHFGLAVDAPPRLFYAEATVLELEGPARRLLPSSRSGGKMDSRRAV